MTRPTKPEPATDDDRSLIARALEKDDHAFTLLMRRFKFPLYRFAVSHVNDADDAEDIVQETFVAAHRNLARYNPKYEVSTWLYQITLNKCRDLGRKRKTRNFLRRMTPVIEEQVARIEAKSDPEASLIEQKELQNLGRKIAALPETLRSPLILCAIEGLNHKQASEVLNISPKAVETRIYRARKQLEQLK